MKAVGDKQENEKNAKEVESRKNHRKRVKEKFRRNKFMLDIFDDYEVIELLLFYCIPRQDTKQLAKDLLKRFGSISGVIDADYDMLCKTNDADYQQTALFIKFIFELYKRYTSDYASKQNVIRTPQAAKDYIRGYFLGEQREHMYMICMGNNGKVVHVTRVAEGEADTVSVVPTDIVKIALRANAVRVILAHNHPLGICNPSSQDLRMTSVISDELYRVGVELFDHIIVAPEGEYSMRERDMLPSRRPIMK